LNAIADPPAPGISIESPVGLVQTGVVTCFRNRMPLSIPDTRRHPFQSPGADQPSVPLPRSILLVPMQAQGEPTGVLQVENSRRARSFSSDEQAVAQHLANQIGLAVKLLQQRSFREQLSRSEKLAAVELAHDRRDGSTPRCAKREVAGRRFCGYTALVW